MHSIGFVSLHPVLVRISKGNLELNNLPSYPLKMKIMLQLTKMSVLLNFEQI